MRILRKYICVIFSLPSAGMAVSTDCLSFEPGIDSKTSILKKLAFEPGEWARFYDERSCVRQIEQTENLDPSGPPGTLFCNAPFESDFIELKFIKANGTLDSAKFFLASSTLQTFNSAEAELKKKFPLLSKERWPIDLAGELEHSSADEIAIRVFDAGNNNVVILRREGEGDYSKLNPKQNLKWSTSVLIARPRPLRMYLSDVMFCNEKAWQKRFRPWSE